MDGVTIARLNANGSFSQSPILDAHLEEGGNGVFDRKCAEAPEPGHLAPLPYHHLVDVASAACSSLTQVNAHAVQRGHRIEQPTPGIDILLRVRREGWARKRDTFPR